MSDALENNGLGKKKGKDTPSFTTLILEQAY